MSAGPLVPSGQFVGPHYITPGGVVLPSEVIRGFFDRFNAPVAAPADLIPPSVQEGACHERVLHLRSTRVTLPPDAKCCVGCGHFRAREGQALLRRHGNPFADDPRWGSRAPRPEDLGLCAAQDGNALTSRFWGSIPETDLDGRPLRDATGALRYRWECPDFRPKDAVVSTADPRKGRRFDPWESE